MSTQHIGVDRCVDATPSLPRCPCPLSDQVYAFAVSNTEWRDEMAIPPLTSQQELSSFGDGLWEQRVLPVYDRLGNLLLPRLYGSLVGAGVEVYAVVMHHRARGLDESAFYLQVRYMRVLQEGTT